MSLPLSLLLLASPAAPAQERTEPLVKLPEDFVRFARVPDGGLQPRVAHRGEDLVVLYYKGGETQGDLFLARSTDEARTFAAPVRVNPAAGSVMAQDGNPAGALDLGPDGRTHVTWISAGESPSAFYAREPAPGATELAVVELGTLPGLSYPTAIAVEKTGQVLVFGVATGPATDDGSKPGFRITMRTSADGATFSAAVPIDKEKFDVSEKSGISAHVDEVMGTIFVAYRSSFAVRQGDSSVTRDMRLLSSEDHGATFRSAHVDNWRQQRDPRTTANLFQDPNTTVLAWDSAGDAFWAPIRRNLNRPNVPMNIKGGACWRSHAVGAASQNELILAWIEQPTVEGKLVDRNAPTTLAWQIWFHDGKMPLGRGQAPESPGKSAPAVFPRKDKGFTILY